jgi:hypothetical protein
VRPWQGLLLLLLLLLLAHLIHVHEHRLVSNVILDWLRILSRRKDSRNATDAQQQQLLQLLRRPAAKVG